MRRVHGSHRRPSDEILQRLDRRCGRQTRDDDRRIVARSHASRAESVDRRRRAAMRLLPVGSGHGGRGIARAHTDTDRRSDRRRDARQHLSLWHVRKHSPRHSSCRRQWTSSIKQRRWPMTPQLVVDRRSFLRLGLAGAGGLLVGVYLPSRAISGTATAAASEAAHLNAFIHIAPDDVVTLFIHKAEMGQGTVTSLSMLLAEELDCDWTRIRTEFPGVDRAFGPSQGVFGSASIRSSFMPLRQAGATARAMLVEAAASKWGIDPSACRTANGVVMNPGSSARLSYGALADAASKLTMPSSVPVKDARQFTLIGKPIKRLDTPSKVDGTAEFGIDVRLPGLKYAVIARCPVFGGTLRSFDDTKAKHVAGVRQVVRVSTGIAVVADNTWAAMEGRRALEIVWDEGPMATRSSETLSKMFADMASQPGAEARRVGDTAAAATSVTKTITAVYETPYLAHAPMEPLNCTAHVRADACEVWASTQNQTAARQIAAHVTGLPLEQVQVHTLYMGGGFGRRAGSDYVGEAVEIAKAVGVPIKLQ